MDFNDYEDRFLKVNEYYRHGLLEACVNEETYESLDGETNKQSLTLEDAAARLADVAMSKLAFLESNGLAGGNSTSGREHLTPHEFKVYARSIVNAYEISDYFLNRPERLDLFLENILNLLSPRSVAGLLPSVGALVNGYLEEEGANLPDSALVKIADELILMALCAANSIYRNHTTRKYEEGRKCLQDIGAMIDELKVSKGRNSYGLLGLQRYLLGRVLFGLGHFRECETAFAESAEFYSERIKLMSLTEVKTSDTIEEARILSLRRATLARCLGSAYLYFVQSKLERSLDLLKIGVPILTLDCGRVNAAYCDLIQAMATRAKYTDNPHKLTDCEDKVRNCLEIFKRYVPKGHYVPRCQLELIRIKDCQAIIDFPERTDDGEGLEDRLNEHYWEIYREIGEVIAFTNSREQTSDHNRRMAAAAFILRSQCRRHHLRMLYKSNLPMESQRDQIDECIKDAEEALEKAGTIKQLRCEAHLAWGQALQFKHDVATQVTAGDDGGGDGWREYIREKYFDALSENDKENPRITATALLCLTELEMTGRVNYYYSKRYFEKYEKVAQQIEDRKCRLFADELRKRLELPHTDFFVDVDSDQGLKPSFWKKRLEEFLIKQAMYRIARRHKGKLPARDQKKGAKIKETGASHNSAVEESSSAPAKPGRETTQSILTKGFMEELHISRVAAYDLAFNELEEFKKIKKLEVELAKHLNSPD